MLINIGVRLFYKKCFFVHTHTQLLAKRHGPAWSIRGQMLFFTHFSMLSPSQHPQTPKKKKKKTKQINYIVDLTSKILTTVFSFFLFKMFGSYERKGKSNFFNKLRAAAQVLLRSEQSFRYLSFRIREHLWA